LRRLRKEKGVNKKKRRDRGTSELRRGENGIMGGWDQFFLHGKRWAHGKAENDCLPWDKRGAKVNMSLGGLHTWWARRDGFFDGMPFRNVLVLKKGSLK